MGSKDTGKIDVADMAKERYSGEQESTAFTGTPATAVTPAQIQSFQSLVDYAEDKASARGISGQFKQAEAIDLQLEEKHLVMKQMDKALQDETAAKPALAALTPASTLPTRPMVPNLQANA